MKITKNILITCLVLMPAFLSAQTIEANQFAIWGIDEEEISIPDGSIVTEAILTIQNVTSQDTPFYLHLLDNMESGLLVGTDEGAGDYFDSFGIVLSGVYENGNFVCRFSQIENTQSAIRSAFVGVTSVTLADSSTAQLSSALLELMDYVGNGRGMAIGIDADIKTTFTNITLDLQIKSYQENIAPVNHVISLIPLYQQSLNFNGLVVMEAENFHGKVAQGDHDWFVNTSLPYSSGGAAMIADPNASMNIDTDYAASSPRLDYRINFVQTGTYYVWVCGYASGPSSDSCHIGLDNQELAGCDRIAGFTTTNEWVWSSTTTDSASRATFVVNSTGEHTLNLWMRESGLGVDAIVITTNPDYIPDHTSLADPFEQDANGLVVMEAEDFHGKMYQGGHDWSEIDTLAGSSGEMAMQCGPDIKTIYKTGYSIASPRLDYRINFTQTGTHYVWIRGYKTGSSNDSCHVGLNNQELASCDRISKFKKSKMWCWSSTTLDSSSRATFNVGSAGEHTLNLWMYEDGFSVDMIVVTTNPNYAPDLFAQTSRGLIKIEAEKYHGKAAQGGYDWSVFSDKSSSGKMAMIAVPGIDETVDTDYSINSARLDYKVNFVRTGIHYIWVRGYTTDITRGSCHAGLDYQELDSCSRIGGFPKVNAWAWSNKKLDASLAVINVDTVGEHIVNLWMRDSGFRADKIVITANPKYKP